MCNVCQAPLIPLVDTTQVLKASFCVRSSQIQISVHVVTLWHLWGLRINTSCTTLIQADMTSFTQIKDWLVCFFTFYFSDFFGWFSFDFWTFHITLSVFVAAAIHLLCGALFVQDDIVPKSQFCICTADVALIQGGEIKERWCTFPPAVHPINIVWINLNTGNVQKQGFVLHWRHEKPRTDKMVKKVTGSLSQNNISWRWKVGKWNH